MGLGEPRTPRTDIYTSVCAFDDAGGGAAGGGMTERRVHNWAALETAGLQGPPAAVARAVKHADFSAALPCR